MAKSRRKKSQQRYDTDQVREAARGQWASLIATLAGIDPDILDGKHHPCPRCGGTDRFRFTDRDHGGSAICNACGKWGDGFGFLAFLRGEKFYQSLAAVADQLGIEPTRGSKASAKESADPAAHLRWLNWDERAELQVAFWCLTKPPIKPAAVLAVGGKLARYREQYTVIALPVWQLSPTGMQVVCGWSLYNITGAMLPKFSGDGGEPEWVKVKITHGSKPGLIGPFDRIRQAATVWKVEGPSDLLAALSQADLPGDHAVVTNANGAGEKPARWISEFLGGAQ